MILNSSSDGADMVLAEMDRRWKEGPFIGVDNAE